MKQPLPPCKNCQTREPACQSGCEGYKQYRLDYAKYQAQVQANKNKSRDVDNFKYIQVKRCKEFAGR